MPEGRNPRRKSENGYLLGYMCTHTHTPGKEMEDGGILLMEAHLHRMEQPMEVCLQKELLFNSECRTTQAALSRDNTCRNVLSVRHSFCDHVYQGD